MLPPIQDNTDPENCDKTSNPEFWSNFYWGGGCGASKKVCENRDLFLSVFSGVRKAKYFTSLVANHHNKQSLFPSDCSYGEILDHSEYYDTKKINNKLLGKIIMFHPYYISDSNVELVKDNGFLEIKPMYSSSARSFIKIVSSSHPNIKHKCSYTAAMMTLNTDISPLLL
mgnify:FL=1